MHQSRKFIAAFSFLLTTTTSANPVLDNVGSGNVSIQQNGNTVTINQSSSRVIINWQSFNIDKQETTRFIQPNGGIALNRIDPTQGASQIFGKLSATGQIILINSAGIYFAPGSYVNVGSMIATTSNLSDKNFLSGNYHFDSSSAYSNASIINQGTIVAANHGLIALVGTNVTNTGLIQANLGKVILASGEAFTLSFTGDNLVNFTFDPDTAARDRHITNTGSLIANGGTVFVTAQKASNVLDNVINMDGIVQARSVQEHNGTVIISGDEKSGVINVSANIDVGGTDGAGNISIRGHEVTLAPKASLHADSIRSGNGGRITLWSDETLNLSGEISAQGGKLRGQGGWVETSSLHGVNTANVKVNTLSKHGKNGLWLLDPADITISDSPTAGDNILNTDINNNLATTNITIRSLDGGNITVSAPITWTSSNTLFLDSGNDIILNDAISGVNGSLILSAANHAKSITTGAMGTIDVANFNLMQGQWFQASDVLPSFNVRNNFQINSGVMPNAVAQFIRSASDNGDGSEDHPYVITDVYGLQGMGSTSSTLSSHYLLANNIDAGSTLAWNNGQGFVPIGNEANPFSGSLEGEDNIIRNLVINRPDENYIGLFGATSASAFLSHLILSDISISGNTYVGSLVGANNGEVRNSAVTASSTNFSITASGDNVGGLIGNHQSGLVADSYASINVSGHTNVGGLIGFASGGTLTSSAMGKVYATGNVIGSGNQIGGLIGNNYLSLDNVTASGNVTGTCASGCINIGGLLGFSLQEMKISHASYTGAFVSAPTYSYVGGLVGQGRGIFTDVYATTNVTGLNRVGGLIGWLNSMTAEIASTGKGLTFFSGHVQGGGNEIGGLVGFADAKTRITAAAQGYITATGTVTGTGAAGSRYLGGLIGNNAGTLSNLTNTIDINNSNYDGVGGIAGNNIGKLSGMYNSANISGRSRVGGLVGRMNGGSIINSYNSGTVTGASSVGGIVGKMSNGTINRVYNLGNVLNNETADPTDFGGIVGTLDGKSTVTNVYNQGMVKVNNGNNVGGIIGSATLDLATLGYLYNTGFIVGSENTGGLIGAATGTPVFAGTSFFNTNTSGQTSAVGNQDYENLYESLKGKTTAELQTPSTFTGWDFTNTWSMIANTSYPWLQAFYKTPPRIITSNSAEGGGLETDLRVNGNSRDVVYTGADGSSYFLEGDNLISIQDSSIADGDALFLTFNDSNRQANAIGFAPENGGQMGFNNSMLLVRDTLTVGFSQSGFSFNNAQLFAAAGGDSHALFTLSGNDLIMNHDKHFATTSSTTYNVIGNLSTSGQGRIQIAGAIAGGGNALTIHTESSDNQITGVISDLDMLIKTGSGSLTLSGNNTYSGTTEVNQGKLIVTNENALGNNIGKTIVNSDASLIVAGINLDENIVLNNGELITTGNTGLSGEIRLANNTNNKIDITGNLNLHGDINGDAGLIVQGSGQLILSGNIGMNDPLSSFNIQTNLQLADNAVIKASHIAIDKGIAGADHNLELYGNNISVAGVISLRNLMITGTSASSSFSLNTPNYETWTIQGIDAGTFSVEGLTGTGTFNNIHTLTGGDAGNLFVFTDQSRIGFIHGGSLDSINTLDFQGYNSNVNIRLSNNKFNGQVDNNGQNIVSYDSIDDLVGNPGKTILTVTGEQGNQIVYTGEYSGYLGDPLTFSGMGLILVADLIIPSLYAEELSISSQLQVSQLQNNLLDTQEDDNSANVSQDIDKIKKQTQKEFAKLLSRLKINAC